MALEGDRSISSTLPTRRDDDMEKDANMVKQGQNSDIVYLRDVLSNPKFNRYLLFNFLFIGTSFLPQVFIVNYGARWFAGCNPNSSNICFQLDYTKLNFYQSLATSMKGAIAFFFAGFVGRLSDAYGRKIFLILHPILYSLQILPLLFANNFLGYLLLTPCAGLVGASLGLSPMMSAYISDVLPPNQRTFGFAVSYGSAGVALLSSAIISLMVSLYMSDYINFVLILILYAVQTIYVWLYIDESLDDKYRKNMSKKKLFNPLRPLLQIRNNRIVFWISVVQFLITFMEVGILNICMVYILTELGITNNDSNFLLMFTFIISVSFGLFGATAGVIPASRKYSLDCCWSAKYRPMTIRNCHDLSHRMSVTEQSQMSLNSVTYSNTINAHNHNSNNTHLLQTPLALNVITDIDEDSMCIDGAIPSSPITPSVPYRNVNAKKQKKKKKLLPFHRNQNRNNMKSEMANYRMPMRTWKDYNNLVIGTFLSFLSLLLIGCVAWIHSTIYIAMCGICVGCAVGITFPSANGVATNSLRNDEQGKGFGIIYAVKGITSAIAPFVFGIFYTYLQRKNVGPIIFLMGMLFTAIAFGIIVFPLRWVLCDQQGYKRRNCLLPINGFAAYT